MQSVQIRQIDEIAPPGSLAGARTRSAPPEQMTESSAAAAPAGLTPPGRPPPPRPEGDVGWVPPLSEDKAIKQEGYKLEICVSPYFDKPIDWA
jgi:hypothetical protein